MEHNVNLNRNEPNNPQKPRNNYCVCASEDDREHSVRLYVDDCKFSSRQVNVTLFYAVWTFQASSREVFRIHLNDMSLYGFDMSLPKNHNTLGKC